MSNTWQEIWHVTNASTEKSWQTHRGTPTLVLDSPPALMAARFPYSQRSKDAPMDYQWTNRSPVKPAWAAGGDEPSTPRKRM
jgi:hypothetical protein